jgi:hypothetical protein
MNGGNLNVDLAGVVAVDEVVGSPEWRLGEDEKPGFEDKQVGYVEYRWNEPIGCYRGRKDPQQFDSPKSE